MRLALLCAAILTFVPATAWASDCQSAVPDRDAVDALTILNRAELEFLRTSGRPGRLEDLLQQKTLQQMAKRSPAFAPLIQSMVDETSISLPGHTLRLLVTHDGYTIVVKETQGCQRTYMTDDRGIIFTAEPLAQEVSDARRPRRNGEDRK